MTRTVIGTAFALALVAGPLAQDAKYTNALLQAAQTKEAIQNDLTGAISLYEQAVKAAGADRALAPRTLLALARAYEKAGRDEARPTYQRIVAEYADSGTAATTARTRLAALGQASGGAFEERNFDARIQEGENFHTISPDGRSSAYVARRTGLKVAPTVAIFTLYVRDLSTGKDRAVAQPKSANESMAPVLYWSPNSQRIAYSVNGATGGTDRRVLTVATGESRSLGEAVKTQAFMATWSPNSEWIALGSRSSPQGAWEYHAANVATRAVHALGSTTTFPAGVRWSPDGGRLALVVSSPTPAIVVMSAGGQQVRRIAIPAATADTTVSLLRWTPDDRIMFSRPVEGGNDWYAAPAAAGNPARICEGRGRSGGDGCADISPDGTLQVTRKVGGGGRIALRSTIDGSEKMLTLDAVTEESLGFSPDGQFLAFRSNREGPWGVYVVAVKQIPAAHPARITQLESADTGIKATWTTRGLALQMGNSQHHLYRVDLDPQTGRPAGDPGRLTSDGPSNGSAYVSPDNKLIAYVTGTFANTEAAAVTIVASNGTGRRVLTNLARASEALMGWRSPAELLIGTFKPVAGAPPNEEWTFKTVNVASGQVRDVGGKPLRMSRPLQYVAATDEIFSYAPHNAGVDVFTVNGNSSRRVDFPQGFFDFTVGYNGRLFAYSTADYEKAKAAPVPGDTRLRNLDGGPDRVLVRYADSDDGSQLTYEFSRDGRFLIYQTPTMEMRIMDVQNPANSWPLSASSGFRFDGGEPSWSPDGRFVVVEALLPRVAFRLFEGITPATVKGR